MSDVGGRFARCARAWVVCLAVLFAAGCGGGGGGGEGGADGPAADGGGAAARAMAVTTTLDPAFTPTSLKVPTVTTLQDRQPLGSPVQVGDDQGGVTGVVFGHDESGEIALAGYPDPDGRLVLSAESTVLTLAVSALSVEFPQVSRAGLLASVRENAGFSGLVQYLQQAIQDNHNKLLDTTFVGALQSLIQQVATSLSPVHLQGKELTGQKLTTDELPVLIQGAPDLVPWYRGEVELQEHNPAFVLGNGTLVALEISAKNVAGTTTDIAVAGPDELANFANARQSISFGFVADVHRNNAISVLNAINAIFGPTIGSCMRSVIFSLAANEALVELGANPGLDPLATAASNLLGADLAVTLAQCGVQTAMSSTSMWLPIVRVVVFTHGFLKMGQHLKEWGYFFTPKTVALCISDTGSVRNCVSEIRLKQPLPVLLPDDSVSGILEYRDVRGNLTLAHPGELELEYVESGERRADLTELPGGFLTAMESGIQIIRLQDKATNASFSFAVEVDQPAVSTAPIHVVEGGTADVDLISSRTRRAIKVPTTLTVSTKHPEIASAVRTGNRVTVTGHRAGDTVLRVDSASSEKIVPLEVPITVEANASIVIDMRTSVITRLNVSSPHSQATPYLYFRCGDGRCSAGDIYRITIETILHRSIGVENGRFVYESVPATGFGTGGAVIFDIGPIGMDAFLNPPEIRNGYYWDHPQAAERGHIYELNWETLGLDDRRSPETEVDKHAWYQHTITFWGSESQVIRRFEYDKPYFKIYPCQYSSLVCATPSREAVVLNAE